MRYPLSGEKVWIEDMLRPGLSNRLQPRCFIRRGAEVNEATLSLALDINRSQIEDDLHIVAPGSIGTRYRPETNTDAPAAVEGGALTFIRIMANGGIRISPGWPGFGSTSYRWLIGTIRYELRENP